MATFNWPIDRSSVTNGHFPAMIEHFLVGRRDIQTFAFFSIIRFVSDRSAMLPHRPNKYLAPEQLAHQLKFAPNEKNKFCAVCRSRARLTTGQPVNRTRCHALLGAPVPYSTLVVRTYIAQGTSTDTSEQASKSFLPLPATELPPPSPLFGSPT